MKFLRAVLALIVFFCGGPDLYGLEGRQAASRLNDSL
jgi:hypothetical protein